MKVLRRAGRQSILAVFLFGLVIIGACDQSGDASITFYDDTLKVATIEALDQNGVKYKLQENTLWYSLDDEKAVKRISNEVFAARAEQFTLYDSGIAEKFVSILEDAGIAAEMTAKGDGSYVVRVPVDKRDEAKRLMLDVLFGDKSN
jgi:hypothetical protein